ncbi:MAG: ABC transporter permease [Actinobacteria bacterium]|nr:ABC transporter permease [Actinomycetota bacterium]
MFTPTSKNGLRALKVFYGLFVVFLYTPIVLLLLFSFNSGQTPVFPLKSFTLRWYRELLANHELLGALRTSAEVAAGSSAVAVSLGILAAIVLVRRRFFGKGAVSALLISPLVVPYVVFGISLLILFQALSIPLSIITVMIGHVVLSLPYTILVLVPRLERIDVALEEAAKDLGASGWRTFRSITLPLILPAIVSAFMIAFTLSFDEYAVASFVIGRQVTYPIYLFSQLRFPSRLPQVIAVAVLVMTASILVILGTEIGRRMAERKLGAELESGPAGQL